MFSKPAYVALTAMLLTASTLAQASPPVFDYTVPEFKRLLNDRIKSDTLDKSALEDSTVKICRKTKERYECSFNDAGFNKSVTEMKKLDILNGNFDQDIRLTLDTVGGKISSIRLNGDRGDPANLFQFVGTVADVFQVFDPKVVATDEKLKALNADLGLMRGDDAEDVGKFKVVIKPYAAVKCLMVPSKISTGEVCVWIPRS